MNKYFFVLGRYPEISVSEITSVFQQEKLEYSLFLESPEIAVFTVSGEFDLTGIFASLGGSIKCGLILGEATLDRKETEFADFLSAEFLKDKVIKSDQSSKVHFGISIYDGGGEKEIVDSLESSLKDFNSIIKENLGKAGISSGFLRIKEKTLSSVAVIKNQLLSKGFELCLISIKDKILFGKTLRVQDFTSFTRRDMLRPGKDKKSGILPVKLARMMVNLLGYRPDSLLDPFCGSGTVLIEAALLGIKNLSGSDIATRAISDTRMNMDWLIHEYGLNKNKYKFDLKIADAASLDKTLAENSVAAIVTEPFLGPPQFHSPDNFKSKRILSELSPLYSRSLKTFSKILKKNARAVLAFPYYISQSEEIFMDRKTVINSGLKQIASLKYSSPGQFVGREIVILEKI